MTQSGLRKLCDPASSWLLKFKHLAFRTTIAAARPVQKFSYLMRIVIDLSASPAAARQQSQPAGQYNGVAVTHSPLFSLFSESYWSGCTGTAHDI